MKTGVDCTLSLSVHRTEGYPVVEHGKASLITDKKYYLTISNPAAWTDCGRVKFNNKKRIYVLATWISYNDMWDIFLNGGKKIKLACDYKIYPIPSPKDEPDFSDFTDLAETIIGYFGPDALI